MNDLVGLVVLLRLELVHEVSVVVFGALLDFLHLLLVAPHLLVDFLGHRIQLAPHILLVQDLLDRQHL